MQVEIDIIEDDILNKYPKVLDTLLCNQTTNQNIIWATDNYQNFGANYSFSSPISTNLITGSNSKVIMPRVLKNKELQRTRVKEMAEVYTPSWVCNDQNNSIDNDWFGKKNIFNKRVIRADGSVSWRVNKNKIVFPKDKTWKDYVNSIVLEITCGEAPYLASRYDATNGKYIAVKSRIGLLDRKLRVISENVNDNKEWLSCTKRAYQNTYGYEFHGDSLLLARESLLYTFIENYSEKFNDEPKLVDIQEIAHIISWNIWQMDGLKFVIPHSCTSKVKENKNLFDDLEKKVIKCKGCEKNDKNFHNGIYCTIMDWTKKEPIRFVDLTQG